MASKQVFIGGTGRSGSTILGMALGRHREVLRLPFEMRYILDPDGIIDLVPALSDEWDPWRGDAAVQRFDRLIRTICLPPLKGYPRKGLLVTLPKIGMAPPSYTGRASYVDHISKKHMEEVIGDFIADLSFGEYKGYWCGTSEYEFSPRVVNTRMMERAVVVRRSREFVDGLMGEPLKRNEKSMWLDHTPFNIAHAGFLHELFPDMKLIHIHRDMRDVVCSWKTKAWGSKKTEDICIWVGAVLDRWEQEKEKVPRDSYMEMGLQELIVDPEGQMRKVCRFMKMKFDPAMLETDLSRGHTGRWKKELSADDRALIKKHLGKHLKEYGYR